MVELLLQHGADPVQANAKGQTPLYAACQYGHFQCSRILVNKANVNLADRDGRSPLFLVAERGTDVDTAKLLRDYGADPAQKTIHGQTPLDVARRSTPVFRLVLQHLAAAQ